MRRLPKRLAFALPLLRRLPAVGAIALVASTVRLCAPAPPDADETGVAAMLGEAVGGDVQADGFVWERSRGWLADAILGRRALFLAEVGDEPRDLYRAAVRVSREGQPIAVGDVVALTETPLGDETDLHARGSFAAFATRWDDAVQGVTVLDLRGASNDGLGIAARLGAGATRWRREGSAAGLGRIELAFRRPPGTLRMQLLDGELRMAVGTAGKAASLALDSLAFDHDPSLAGEAWRQPPDGAILPELRDRLGSWWRRLAGAKEAAAVEPEAALPEPGPTGWPPSELDWTPIDVGLESGAPLQQATVTLEGEVVTLVAIDSRQLDLGFRAGRRHPKATTGPHGSGTIPENLAPRVVAAFNGGEAGGTVDGGRVLVPPLAGSATVAIDRHGRARLGALGPRRNDLVALRQGEPLIVDGQRPESAGGRMARSALGRTEDGFLVYGFSDEAHAQSLALAMRQAGCVDAVALRRDEAPIGMVSWPVGQMASGRPLDETMSLAPEEIAAGAEHDFFYLVAREPHPKLGGLDWKPAEGRQPEPTSWPAIHVAATQSLGVEVALHHVAPGRLRWAIVPGEKETAAQTSAQSLDDLEAAVLAINLGLAHRKDNRRGLVLDGVQTLPMRPFLGALETADGDLAVTYTLEGLVPSGDATELPLLVEASRVRRHAKKLGARRRRAAACTAEDGSLLVANAIYDTAEPVALALMDLGCERVVELNRGRQVRSFVYQAGSSSDDDADGERKLLDQYVETALFGLESSTARGRARGL